MQVLAAHWGWSHRGAREFCLEALRSDWKRGFAWLNEASVTQAPCLRMFNLAGYFKWSLGGMPVGEVEGVYGSAESDFRKVLASGQWVVNDPASLLENFITDTSPFNWRVDNAALRLAEIGGLSKALGLGAAEFDRCAELHQQSIDAGMFGLGSSDAWITSLRKRLTAQ